MHEDRDNYIIVITLLPIVLFIGLYATWRGAGEPGIALPDLPLPAIPLPNIPNLEQYLPPWLVSWGRNFGRNADSVIPAIAIGIFIGLVGMGTLVDALKKAWSFFASTNEQRKSPPTDDPSSPDYYPPELSTSDLT